MQALLHSMVPVLLMEWLENSQVIDKNQNLFCQEYTKHVDNTILVGVAGGGSGVGKGGGWRLCTSLLLCYFSCRLGFGGGGIGALWLLDPMTYHLEACA